ncbi:amino acid ABC transporter permease [Pseudomonas sp. ABAC21]|nr:amino acid ABC transporter permease [Pseudomonas sp. ABAC21]
MSSHTFKPDMPPPNKVFGPMAWMRANLFSSWLNTLLTLLAFYLIYLVVPPILNWAILDANWVGTTRADCTKEGACWVFIQQRFGQFMYGYYPGDLRWRVDLTVWLAIVGVAPLFISRFPRKAIYGLGFLVLYPIIAFFLLHGGAFGLTNVARVVCVTFIEFWRGVPLITVLFMSSVMLPLFLPEGMGIDKLLRALIGVILFQSAYVAEVVRGGLQAIPKGQYEAAAAMGLGYWRSMGLVILPQALKMVIPGIVNTFIALFKDTSLVIIIGLFDLLNSVKQAAADPKWLGMATEGYVFAALVFWIFCFGMSRYSIHLEHKLDTGHKR